jgi:hypothetical protein
MNEEKATKRKDWIKNAAIIFLSVMLVLTFFSNTIMNYSLPEVATETVESGSITAKIRGTGTVTSDDPYQVSIQESRVISSVAVKEGDTVEKDQVLFYLEDKDSDELEKAQQELDALVLAYTQAILSGEISNEAFQNIQSGSLSTTAAYQATISAAKQKVDNAQATVDSLERQITVAGTTTDSQSNTEEELKNAETAKTNAAATLADAQSRLEAANAASDSYGSLSSLNNAVSSAVLAEGTKKVAYENAKTTFFNKIYSGKDADTITGKANEFETQMTGSDRDAYIKELAGLITTADASNSGSSGDDAAATTAQQLFDDLYAKYTEYSAAKTERESAQQAITKKSAADSELNAASAAYNSAKNAYDEAATAYDKLNSELSADTTASTQQKAQLEIQKADADAALTKAKDELTQLITDISKELDLSNQNSIIREKKEEIAELKEKAVGATVVAPVAGVVTAVNKTAGETTVPDEALAVMQPEGKGFTVSFSVTADQAKKVTVGEQADVQNSWYYDDVTASVSAIKPDPENPGQKKLLVFSVEGDVQTGQSLSLSVGQKSVSYDLLVPNSAVREDNNGKFILIVESKNSPLGNRYMAKRVDVTVLGSDDVKTAISADLYGYEYVITTSTKPVEAGKQVRLADQ